MPSRLIARRVIDGCRPLMAPHFNLTVELPLKAIVRGYSWKVIPITWRNRRTGEAKLKIKEMGSRYLFICLYAGWRSISAAEITSSVAGILPKSALLIFRCGGGADHARLRLSGRGVLSADNDERKSRETWRRIKAASIQCCAST